MNNEWHGPGQTFDPYGERFMSQGGRARTIRARPLGLPVVATIGAAAWVGKRAATRVTPFYLVLLLVLGMPLAHWADPVLIAAIGLGAVIITYSTSRHVSTSDAIAQQWAARATALPVIGTLWVLGWWWMHQMGMPILTEPMLIAYWLHGCVAWSWLYMSKFVGGKVAWRAAQRDFAPTAKRVGLVGGALVSTARTAVGSKKTVDVRGTGRTAKELAADATLPSKLAAERGLAPGTVRVAASVKHAGHIVISEWSRNPWVKPIDHPLAPDFPLAPPVNPLAPIVVGEDPETGKPLTIRMVTEDGGMHWVCIAGTRGGKTVLINNIVEALTRARNSKGQSIVAITMIDILKGMKDAQNWAPAVKAVYAGNKAVPGALAALKRAVELIGSRAEANGRRGHSKHIPTPDEPVEIIIIDEASFLLTKSSREGRQAIEYVQMILKAGASEMVLVFIATQRATLEHLGTGDAKANAMGIAVLPVRRPIEQSQILPDWREEGMPDMSEFGGGAKGAVLLVDPDGWQAGRTFNLSDVQTIRRISTSRCLPGNEGMVEGGLTLPDWSPGRLDYEPPVQPDMDADADELDFDALGSDVQDVPDVPVRPGDRPAASSVRLADGHPDAVRAAKTLASGTHLSGADADQDIAADAAIEEGVANVTALPEPAAADTGPDATDVAMGRMLTVTGWAAGREQARTPAEKAELARLWREHSWRLDQGVKLPDAVNACLRALAGARGADGFTRADAQAALQLVEAVSGRSSVAGWLRVLVNQGHLTRDGDIYRMAQKSNTA